MDADLGLVVLMMWMGLLGLYGAFRFYLYAFTIT